MTAPDDETDRPPATEPPAEPPVEPAAAPPPPSAPATDDTAEPIVPDGLLPRQDRRRLDQEWRDFAASRANLLGSANFLGNASFNNLIIDNTGGRHLYAAGEGPGPVWESGVDPDELRRVVAVFVEPPRPRYAQALDCLSGNRLVIVRGPAGSGKSAAATRLAYDIHVRRRSELRGLSPDTDLRRWGQGERRGQGAVYLIDGLLGTRSSETPDHVWRELAGRLRDADAYLVIAASYQVTFAAAARPYIQEWEPPADALAVLRNHLVFCEVSEVQMAELLAVPAVQTLLTQRPTPHHLYRIAARLKEYCDGLYDSPAEALRDLAISDEAAVAEWFRGARNDEERALWVALAVFNGSRFRLAQEAGELLAQGIRAKFPPPAEAPPESAAPWFAALDLDQDWRTRAGVELRLEGYDGQHLVPAEVVRLRDPSLPQGVLRYLWGRLPSFRPVLLDWLTQLGAHRVSEVRIRAATAAALLAQFEYESVLRAVLEPWVGMNTPATRQSLAYALGSLALTEQYAEGTFVLLHNWATSSEKPRIWAATRAYGVLGPQYPRQAMDGWLGILARYDFRKHFQLSPTLRLSVIDPELQPLLDSLFQAIASFFVVALAQPRGEFVRIYSQIVAALRAWLEENDDEGLLTLTILALFLGLSYLRVGEDVLMESDSADADPAPTFQGQGAPALLVLVHNLPPNAPVLDDLGWLFSRAIRAQPTRRATIVGTLHEWLTYLTTAHDEALYVALRRLLQCLLAQPSFAARRWRREVGLPLEQWAGRRINPLPPAGRLVGELTELQRS